MHWVIVRVGVFYVNTVKVIKESVYRLRQVRIGGEGLPPVPLPSPVPRFTSPGGD